MKHELWYSVVVRDRHGKVVSRERRKSKSFIRQWNDIVCAQVTGATVYFKRIDGDDTKSVLPFNRNLRMVTEPGMEGKESTVVGSGNAAVTISDFAMETQISNGTAVGELSYQAPTVNDSIVSAPNCGFLVERAFVNNSGADVTVREMGIYARMSGTVGAYHHGCVVRDVLGTPQVIPNGGTLSTNCTLRVTA